MKAMNLILNLVLFLVAGAVACVRVIGAAAVETVRAGAFLFLGLASAVLAFLRSVAKPPGVAYAIWDSQLVARSNSSSLTATETSAALTINGTPAGGLALVIHVPKKSVGDTMQVTLQHSTDNSTYTNLLVTETVASVTESTEVPFSIVRRFHTRHKYVRTVTTVAGTSPDFGAVSMLIGDAEQWNLLGVGQNATSNFSA